MKIHFERTGGFAGAAARRSCTIDTDSLSPEEAREVHNLVKAAGLPGLSPTSSSRPLGRDMFRYQITVEDAGKHDRVELSEPDAKGNVRPLVDWLNQRASPGAS